MKWLGNDYSKGDAVRVDGNDGFYWGPLFQPTNRAPEKVHSIVVGSVVMRRDGSTILEDHVNLSGDTYQAVVHEKELSGEWDDLNKFLEESEKVAA